MQLDQAFSDEEFDELDDFLLSDRCAEDAMTMDTLHGFLTALVIGPQEIPMAEWLPRVWGSMDEPRFGSPREAERIIGLITHMMNEIVITFKVAPEEYEPLFCEYRYEGESLLDGEAWAWGFWEGVQLRTVEWDPVFHSGIADLMRPIYLLGADELEEEEGRLVDDPVKRHRLAIEVESAIPHLYRHWLPHRKPAARTGSPAAATGAMRR
ncbi:MAG TPA: UPF0149 family protein [Herbaspirillum sp.]|nr:UPF0149 family protein [Herbaspirillum sp.]